MSYFTSLLFIKIYILSCFYFSDIDDSTVSIKTRGLLQDYGRLMDEPKKGLNNYAKPILTLVGKSKNGTLWKWQETILIYIFHYIFSTPVK